MTVSDALSHDESCLATELHPRQVFPLHCNRLGLCHSNFLKMCLQFTPHLLELINIWGETRY